MDDLGPLAEKIAARLIERKETIGVAEGSAGGLISAALLAVPGASAYFLGGAVVYTAAARDALVAIGAGDMAGPPPATQTDASLLCRPARERLGGAPGRRATGAAGAAGRDLGTRRSRRGWAGGQPLRRSRRTHVYCRRRPGAARRHVAHRPRRTRGEYGRVCGARARSFCRNGGEREQVGGTGVASV